jgi:hypothetical protein
LRNFPAPRNKNIEAEISELGQLKENAETMEEEIMELQITDPHAFEDLMSTGALEHAKNEEDRRPS